MAGKRYPTTDDPEYYNAGQWLGGIAAPAATGAAAGATFGPYGALIGGAGGALIGGIDTALSQDAYLAAQAQQAALNKELASTDVYDRMLQQQGLLGAAGRNEALLAARQGASRAGLTPGAALALERQAVADSQAADAAQRPGMFLAANQADLARRAQVLDEYNIAQGLANNAQSPDLSGMYGQLAGAVSKYGTAYGGKRTTPPVSAEDAATAMAPPSATMPVMPDYARESAQSNAMMARQYNAPAGVPSVPVGVPALPPATPNVAPTLAIIQPETGQAPARVPSVAPLARSISGVPAQPATGQQPAFKPTPIGDVSSIYVDAAAFRDVGVLLGYTPQAPQMTWPYPYYPQVSY